MSSMNILPSMHDSRLGDGAKPGPFLHLVSAMTDNCDLCVEVRPRPRRHYAGHELKDRVPEATLGIAARGEARYFQDPQRERSFWLVP